MTVVQIGQWCSSMFFVNFSILFFLFRAYFSKTENRDLLLNKSDLSFLFFSVIACDYVNYACFIVAADQCTEVPPLTIQKKRGISVFFSFFFFLTNNIDI